MAVPKVITPETLSTWSVETLAELANDAGEQAEKCGKQAVQHGVVAGNALNAAKSQIPHGEWTAWVKTNWNFSHKWATTLMRLASNWNSSSNLEDAETLTEALSMLSEPREKPQEPDPDDDAPEADEPEPFMDSAPEQPAKPSRKSEPRDVEPYSIDDMEKEIRRAICSWFRLVPESQYDELHGTIIEQLNERWVVR